MTDKATMKGKPFSNDEMITVLHITQYLQEQGSFPDYYKEVLDSVCDKLAEMYTQTPSADTYLLSDFNNEELLVMGDSCYTVMVYGDNTDTFEATLETMMDKVNYMDLIKDCPDELDLAAYYKQEFENEEQEDDYDR